MSSSSSTPKLAPEEIKLRGSLLAKNKDLLKLHKDLVFSNVISEEEFWEDRRGLLRAQEMLMNQKRGLTSALVSDDLKPITNQSSDVKYVLTPTIIQTIFNQHPILKKAFTELVGEGKALSEKEFWIEYFKSKFFNDSKTRCGAGSSHLDSFYRESVLEGMDGASALHDENVNFKVSGQFDITRSEEDHVSDYVRYERESAANDDSWNSLRQFNKHSMRVLQSTTESCKGQNTNNNTGYTNACNPQHIEISDLNLQTEPSMAALNVQESQLFASISSTTKSDNLSKSATILENDLKLALEEFQKSSFDPASLAKLNYSKRQALMNDVMKRNNFQIETTSSENTTINSASNTDENLQQLINSSIEVLRHFWRAAGSASGGPSTIKISSERTAKLSRMISVLDRMEAQCIALGDDEKLSNLKQVILRAKLKYSEFHI